MQARDEERAAQVATPPSPPSTAWPHAPGAYAAPPAEAAQQQAMMGAMPLEHLPSPQMTDGAMYPAGPPSVSTIEMPPSDANSAALFSPNAYLIPSPAQPQPQPQPQQPSSPQPTPQPTPLPAQIQAHYAMLMQNYPQMAHQLLLQQQQQQTSNSHQPFPPASSPLPEGQHAQPGLLPNPPSFTSPGFLPPSHMGGRGRGRGNRKTQQYPPHKPSFRSDSAPINAAGVVQPPNVSGGQGGSSSYRGDSMQALEEKFGSITACKGKISELAQDQEGCRFLQRKLETGTQDDVDAVLQEALSNAPALMRDPFANYLLQKLCDLANDSQKEQIIDSVSTLDARGDQTDAVACGLDAHGTRALQKLVESITTEKQARKCADALRPGTLALARDLNGHHVLQRCLRRLPQTATDFIHEETEANVAAIACHRHGCCVLQRCLDYGGEIQQRRVATAVADAAIQLSNDPYGNYAVQYALRAVPEHSTDRCFSRLKGSLAELAVEKFSSNVVERCLEEAPMHWREHIVRELIASSLLPRLLSGPYGNFVVQSAFKVAHADLRTELIKAAEPHIPTLKQSPYGRRVLARFERMH